MFWSWNVEDDDGGDDIVLNEKLLKQLADVGEAIKSRPLWKDGDFGIVWLKLLFTLATTSEAADDEDGGEDEAEATVDGWWSITTFSLIITIFLFKLKLETFSFEKIELNHKKSRKSIHRVVAVSFLPFFLLLLFLFILYFLGGPVEKLLCCYHCELYHLTDDELIFNTQKQVRRETFKSFSLLPSLFLLCVFLVCKMGWKNR